MAQSRFHPWSLVWIALLGTAWLVVGCQPICDDDTCADDDVADDDTGDDDVGDDDTGDDDTGDDDTGEEWGSEEFWTGSSILDPLLDLSTVPDFPHWEVRVYVSDEWFGVDPEVTTVAHGFSSLDLLALDDGLVVIGAINTADVGDDEGEYRFDHLYALSTANLVDWGTHVFPVHDTASGRLTDAALEKLPDGTIRAIYYSTPMEAEGDPVWIPGDHEIKVAYRDGSEFYEEPDPVYLAEGLADPSSCEYDGTYHFFATEFTTVGHAVGSDEYEYQTDPDFPMVEGQVPFCLVDDGEMYLMVQGGGGMPPPTVLPLEDDGGFGPPEKLWSDQDNLELGPCTSPVAAYYDDSYVLICAVFVE